MEQGSAAIASRGHAGAALPGNGWCRQWRPAAAMVVVSGLTGGQRCHRTTSGAALCGWRMSSASKKRRGAGGWSLLFPLQWWAGPPWKPLIDERCAVRDAIGLCRRRPFACQLVTDVPARCVTWMVSTFAVVEIDSSNGHPYILLTLSTCCVQWTACSHACLSRCARGSRETAPVSDGGLSCSWRQNACAKQPERARSAYK